MYFEQTNKNFLNSIYYLDSKQLENEISFIIEKIRNQVKIVDSKHIWKESEAISNLQLLNKINES